MKSDEELAEERRTAVKDCRGWPLNGNHRVVRHSSHGRLVEDRIKSVKKAGEEESFAVVHLCSGITTTPDRVARV